MIHDLRLALRSLAKSPAFTASVIATLALTLGATTAVFSAVHGVLLRPLDFAQPQNLVTVWENHAARGGPEREWTGRSTLRDWRQRNSSLAGIAGFTGWAADLVGTTDGHGADGDAAPERLLGAAVSPGYLAVLGVEPVLGRGFRAEEEEPGRDDVVILGHELWQRRFAADPAVVGSQIRLSDHPYTVVGVLPPGFSAPLQAGAEILRPLPLPADMDDRGAYYVRAVARLAPGVSRRQADADMARVGRDLAAAYPVDLEAVDVVLEGLRESIVGPVRAPLTVLLGAVALVLLIACANVAGLLLVRATVREDEMAVRSALGASRGQLLRQHLVEGLLLAAAGGVAAFCVAAWGVELLRSLAPPGTPRLDGIALDAPVLLFAVAATLATGLVFSAAPAWQASRPRLTGALAGGGRRTASRRGIALRRGLVVAEIALGLALLTGAALLLRSLDELGRTDVGVRTEGVVVASVGLPADKYDDDARITAFYDEVLERLRADPSVRAAGAVDPLPLSGGQSDVSFNLEGEPTEPGREPVTDERVATPGYFAAAGIPLLAGRGFDERDAAGAPLSVIVSRRFAERYLPGRDPLGRRLKLGQADNELPWLTIVGVVGSVRDNAVARPPDPEIYLPLAQNTTRALTLVAYAPERPQAAMQALRGAVAAVDPERPLAAVGTFDELVSQSLASSRLLTVLLAVFASVALLLSLLGIYGVTAYAVGQRRREIGVRMALGADRRRVVALVLSGGGLLVALGLALGVALSLLLGRALVGLLYGVTPGDPTTLTAAALLLAAAAAGACWLPARRAARIDPVTALREG